MGFRVLACRTLVVSFLVFTTNAAYPSTYPYENDATGALTELPPSTPSYTYDDADPGGYIHTLSMQKDLNLVYPGYFCFSGGEYEEDGSMRAYADGVDAVGDSTHLLVVGYGAPPRLPLSVWNCTRRNIGYATEEDEYIGFNEQVFLGILDNKEVECGSDGCCRDWVGRLMYSDMPEKTVANHAFYSTVNAVGLCAPMHEAPYCTLLSSASATNCFEYMTGPDVREQGIVPCYNNLWHFYFGGSCPVYETVATLDLGFILMDPQSYIDTLTLHENGLYQFVTHAPDRVCHPTSYFKPEMLIAESTADSTTTTTTTTTTGSTTSTTTTSTTTTSSESSDAACLTVVRVLLSLFLVL